MCFCQQINHWFYFLINHSQIAQLNFTRLCMIFELCEEIIIYIINIYKCITFNQNFLGCNILIHILWKHCILFRSKMPQFRIGTFRRNIGSLAFIRLSHSGSRTILNVSKRNQTKIDEESLTKTAQHFHAPAI